MWISGLSIYYLYLCFLVLLFFWQYCLCLEVIKVTKLGTIRYVRYGFILMYYRNYVRLEIFDFKNVVTLKTGLRIREGH